MDAFETLLTDTAPIIALVLLVGRWLSSRIDRVLDLHERLIQNCYDSVPSRVLDKLPPSD